MTAITMINKCKKKNNVRKKKSNRESLLYLLVRRFPFPRNFNLTKID